MSLGKNIHNAFVVVFETLKSIEKLMIKCTSEIDGEAYHMPSNHTLFYNAIHAVDMYEEIETENGLSRIVAKVGYESKVSSSFWGFQNAVCSEIKLVDITADNYKDKIFGTIEYLSNQ